MAKFGGPQKGAGRPKGRKNGSTLDAEAIRDYWRAQIAKDQQELYQAMKNKAVGVMVQMEKMGMQVYKEFPPDPAAFKALTDHLPKLPQPVSGTGDNGEIVHKVLGVTMIVPKNGERDQTDA